MDEIDELIVACLNATKESEPLLATRDVLRRAVRDGAWRRRDDAQAGLNVLYNAPDLTILDVVWPPLVSILPHDHRMWAAIGIYEGAEDNAMYRRDGSTIVASGVRELREHDVLLLGDDTIHGVHNPARSYTGALHVYGGDLVNIERSQWNPETLLEEPYDAVSVGRGFREAAARFADEPG